jgi:hypothetical protein
MNPPALGGEWCKCEHVSGYGKSTADQMVGVTKAVIVGFTNLAVTGTLGNHPAIMM